MTNYAHAWTASGSRPGSAMGERLQRALRHCWIGRRRNALRRSAALVSAKLAGTPRRPVEPGC